MKSREERRMGMTNILIISWLKDEKTFSCSPGEPQSQYALLVVVSPCILNSTNTIRSIVFTLLQKDDINVAY